MIALVVGLWPAIAFLAPGPWGIAINPDTRECASYWPGDEYAQNALPRGWLAYFPDDSGLITIGDRSCSYSSTSVEECCRDLGYTYVDREVSTPRITSYGLLLLTCRFWYIIPITLAFALLCGVLLKHVSPKNRNAKD
jgi:hypothetical protein